MVGTGKTTASEMVDSLLLEADRRGASDIHMDVSETSIIVRLRVDGHLEEYERLPKALHESIIARLKVLANLRTDEHNRPQDGRFKFDKGPLAIDIRLSVAPTLFGENAVLRILGGSQNFLSLSALGLSSSQEKLLLSTISRPQGFVLVTGPTGSGKTTTIYSLLKLIARRPISLVTIEDPIEYSIPEAVQMQVNLGAGFSFVEGLRGILRQDPDAILVGEIRDAETAGLAINAALTGHLVLSTLHSSSSLGVLPRLVDLQVDPYLISSSLSLIVSQRLVRRICDSCREEKKLSSHESLWLKEALDTALPEVVFYGAGCGECDGRGYRGRIGLFEILSTSRELLEQLPYRAHADERMNASLFVDGMQKVASGDTTVEELLSLSYAEALL